MNLLILLFLSNASAQVETNFSAGGAVRVGDSTTTCDNTIEGAIRYDADSAKSLDYCDGTNWITLLTSAIGGAVINGGNSFAAPMIIGTNDSNNLSFETDGTTKMTIDTSGKVGIGTDTPVGFIDIRPIAGWGAQRSFNISATNSATTIRCDDNASDCNGSGHLTLANRFLTAANQGTALNFHLANGQAAGNLAGQISVLSETGNFNLVADRDSYMKFSTMLDNVSYERLRISSNGYIGIGTATPGQRLDVEGSIVSGPKGIAGGDGGAILLEELAGGGTNRTGFRAPDALGSDLIYELPGVAPTDGQILSSSAAGLLTWVDQGGVPADSLDWDEITDSMTLDATTSIEMDTNSADLNFDANTLFIDSSTNRVGIGTNAPAAGLEVVGGINSTNSLNFLTQTAIRLNGTTRLQFWNTWTETQFPLVWNSAGYPSIGSSNTAASPPYAFATDTDTGVFRAAADTLGFSTAANERMRIDSSGNVGIGTTNPIAPLHIEGNVGGSFVPVVLSNVSDTAFSANEIQFRGSSSDVFMGSLIAAWDSGSGNHGNLVMQVGQMGTPTNGMEMLFSTQTFFPGRTLGIDYSQSGQMNIYDRTSDTNTVTNTLVLGHEVTSGAASNGIGSALSFQAETGTDNTSSEVASIQAVLDDAANNSKDGSLRFATIGPGAGAGVNTASEKMRITSSGNVGIGTSAPDVELDVNTGTINAAAICDENNENCKDISAGWSGGAGDIVNGGNATGATVVIGTNDAQDFAIESQGSNRVLFKSDGDILFGGSSLYGGEVSFQFVTNPWDETGDYANINNDAFFNGLGNTGTATALRNWIRSNAINDHNELYGSHNIVSHWGSGNTTLAAGSYNEFNNNGSTTTNGVGVFSDISVTGGTLTNGYGFRSSMSNTATFTNGYGLYLEDVPASNDYGVYQAGTNDDNYFAGKVGIGSTSPAVSLDLSGKTDSVRLPAGTTAQRPGTPAGGDIRYNSDNSAVEVYQGSTVGWGGVPSLIGRADLTGQSGSIAKTAIFTPTTDGLYQFCMYVGITTTGTSGTITGLIEYEHESGLTDKQTQIVNVSSTVGSGASGGCSALFVVAGTSVGYKTNVTGTPGALQYTLHVRAHRLD